MTLGNGKPCKKCGTSEWYSGGGCKECNRRRVREWEKNNREKKKFFYGRWAENNKDKLKEYNKNRPRENRQSANKRTKKWREKNPERMREHRRKWERENGDKSASIKKEWWRKNKHKRKIYDAKRRSRKTKAGGSFTASEWNGLCEAYKNKCLKCGKTFPRNKLIADHIKPVVMGGDSNITNIQPLCRSCNSSKGAKHIDYRKGNVKIWVQKELIDSLSD